LIFGLFVDASILTGSKTISSLFIQGQTNGIGLAFAGQMTVLVDKFLNPGRPIPTATG
jgi:hypothetical protein